MKIVEDYGVGYICETCFSGQLGFEMISGSFSTFHSWIETFGRCYLCIYEIIEYHTYLIKQKYLLRLK